MKKILLLSFLIPSVALAQSNYTISGTVENKEYPTKVYLRYIKDNKPQTDSSLVENGKFTFTGNLENILPVSLFFANSKHKASNLREILDIKSFYIDANSIQISAKDSLKTAKLVAGPHNLDKENFKKSIEKYDLESNSILNEYKAYTKGPDSSNKEVGSKIIERFYANRKKIQDLEIDFVKNNPNSYFSLETFSNNFREIDAFEAEKILENFSPQLKAYPLVKTLEARNKARKQVAIGQIAPTFSAPDTLGNNFSLESLKGKYVLIDFWASWCGPCRQENPNVVKAFHKFKDRNFTILGVSLDSETQKEAWLKAITKDQIQNWPQISDLKGWQSEIGRLYAVDAIPQNFLIDPQGKILATNLRDEKLHTTLEEILK